MRCTRCSRVEWLEGKTNSFLNEGLIPQINPGGAARRPAHRAVCRLGTCALTGTFRDLHSARFKGQIGAG